MDGMNGKKMLIYVIFTANTSSLRFYNDPINYD